MTSPFRYETRVFVADTNCFGTVYFARYFEWQGRAREVFFRAVLPNFQELMEAGYRLLTVEASMRYAKELRLFEALTIAIDVVELKEASVVLRLAFLRDQEEPVGLGQQRLVLTDRDGRPTPIPEEIRLRLQAHLALNGRAC